MFIDEIREATDASVFQALLLRLVFSVASPAVRDKSDRGLGALVAGCWCHAALCGLHAKTRGTLLLSGVKCALCLV